AHGFLLLAMVPRLFAELFAVPEAEMLVNYGIDKVRFLQPVASGSDLRLNARIVSVTPKGERFLLRIRGDLENRPLDDASARGRRAVVVETLFLVVPPSD
ncbi:MAG: MaoC/PaaZ C-terminal domain-containing protein, partial [Acidobacteriota bacterium]